MKFIDELKGLLGQSPKTPSAAHLLRETLEAGRRAKFAEQYDIALEAFDRAMAIAREKRETALVVVIALHQAELLALQGKWSEAEQILTGLQHTAQTGGQPTQLAYVLSVLGLVAQLQGDWAGARAHYERALKTARENKATSAEGRAMGHLAETYLQEGNASYALHLVRSALTKLNTTGDTELNTAFIGLMGLAMIQTGQDGDGLHVLEQALKLAERMHYRMYERRWSLALGEQAMADGRYQDALAYLQQAINLFPEGSQSAEYVTALCQMSQTRLVMRDYRHALEDARKVIALSEPLSPSVRAAAHEVMGKALRSTGQSSDSVGYFQQAATLYEEAGTDERRIIEVLRHLAAVQADADDLAAEATYEQVLERAANARAELEIAQIQRDMGLMYARRKDFGAAIKQWTAALNYYDENRHHGQAARLLVDIATARKNLGMRQRAIKDYEQALIVLNSVDEQDTDTRGLVLSNAAVAFVDHGDIESADAFFNDAILLAEKTGDQQAEAIRRGNYGWFLIMIGRPRRAIAMLEQAIPLSKSLGLALQAAVQTGSMGMAYNALSDYPVALGYHRQALEQIEGLDTGRWLALAQANLASTLIAMGQTGEAEPLLEQSLARGRTLQDVEVVVAAVSGLARLALLRAQPASVEGLLNEALMLARQLDQRRLLAEILSVRSEQRAALNRADDAAADWQEAQRLYQMLRMPQAKMQPAWISSAG